MRSHCCLFAVSALCCYRTSVSTSLFLFLLHFCIGRSSSKNRRHVNEGTRNVHKSIVASSQLVVEVSELHADTNGRLEITCLATIPAHVGPGEQFADYKTYSVKSEYRVHVVAQHPNWQPLCGLAKGLSGLWSVYFRINALNGVGLVLLLSSP